MVLSSIEPFMIGQGIRQTLMANDIFNPSVPSLFHLFWWFFYASQNFFLTESLYSRDLQHFLVTHQLKCFKSSFFHYPKCKGTFSIHKSSPASFLTPSLSSYTWRTSLFWRRREICLPMVFNNHQLPSSIEDLFGISTSSSQSRGSLTFFDFVYAGDRHYSNDSSSSFHYPKYPSLLSVKKHASSINIHQLFLNFLTPSERC